MLKNVKIVKAKKFCYIFAGKFFKLVVCCRFKMTLK
jgi:hypothetical protein